MRPRVAIPAILVLALSVYLALAAFHDWGAAAGAGQRIAAITQVAYCILGAVAGLAALFRRSLLGPLAVLWVLAVSVAATLAPVVWGETSWLVGIVSGLSGGVFAGLIAWWLVAASAPSLWERASRAALGDRLQRLTPETKARWGRMTCPQMLTHVNDQLRMSMGELAAARKRVPVRFPPLKQLIVYALPWPKGLPTAPELLVRVADGPVWTEEVAAFPGLLDRFGSRTEDAAWPAHPAFGPLSRRGWGVLAYRHVDHHFRQFGV